MMHKGGFWSPGKSLHLDEVANTWVYSPTEHGLRQTGLFYVYSIRYHLRFLTALCDSIKKFTKKPKSQQALENDHQLLDTGVLNKRKMGKGAWVAQSVGHQTLDFSSGHDLMVCEFESQESLSLSLCPYPIHTLSVFPSK